jgi:hypothetical protein
MLMGIDHGSDSVRNNILLDVWRSRMVSYGGHASSITLLRHFYTDDEFAHAQNLAPSNSIEICGLHAEFGAKS